MGYLSTLKHQNREGVCQLSLAASYFQLLVALSIAFQTGLASAIMASPIEIGGKLYTEDSKNHIPLFYTQLRFEKTLGAFSNKQALILENRKTPPTRQAQNSNGRERLLASLSIEGQGQALYLGHRYLPGPRTSYLLETDAWSSFPDLPNGRNQGSLWWLLRLGNMLGDFEAGAFAIESASGIGLSFGQQGLWQFRAHPPSKSASFTVSLGKPNEDSLYLDLLHQNNTTEGFGRLYLKSKSDKSHFFVEGERRAYYDFFNEVHTKPDSPKPPNAMQDPAFYGKPEKFHRGKNGRLNLRSCLWDRLCLEAAGEDRGLRSTRFAGAAMRLPVFLWQKTRLSLMAGVYGTAFRRYPRPKINPDLQTNQSAYLQQAASNELPQRNESKRIYMKRFTETFQNQQNCLSPYENSETQAQIPTPPPLQTRQETISERSSKHYRKCLSGPGFVNGVRQAGRFYSDKAGLLGLLWKADGLEFSLHFLRGKRTAPRLAAELGIDRTSWKLLFGGIYLYPGNDYPADFYWLRVPEEDRASLRFYYEGNAALRLRFLSRHLALSLSMEPYFGKIRLQSRLEWRAFF